jgi:hypothetical protein
MEIKVEVPFSQLLTLVKTLTPTEKAILRKELDESKQTATNTNDSFIDFLLNGPVYNEEDIAIIEENRKSIAAWRTEN